MPIGEFGQELDTATVGTLSDAGLALEAVTRGEIDTQISTAKRYPRSVTAFKRTATELATLDERTAASMYYRLPRDGKKIEGPSVRMAEVVAYSWGNLRVDARIAAENESTVTAVGTGFDLERNYAVRTEVTRRITDRHGKRYSEDMVAVTKNAACSIAMREAVFKCVPRALYLDIVEQAKLASIGKAKTMDERRQAAFEWFVKAGVDQARILAHLGRKGMEDVTVDDLVTLTGYKTAIKDGELQIDEAFPVAGEVPPSERAAAAEARLHDTAARRREATPAPAEPTYPDLDAAGLTGDTNDTAPEFTPAEEAFFALVRDTAKGSGRTPLAGDTDRARLRELLAVMYAAGINDVGDRLTALADDPKLAATQARTILLHAVGANLIGAEPSGEPEAEAGAGDDGPFRES